MRFLRRNWTKASRLGKGRKNKQVWRSAKGRHSKTRNKRKGYPAIVEIGFRTEKKGRDLLDKKEQVRVSNVSDLSKVQKNQIAVIANVGYKKKIAIAEEAKKKGIEVYNVNCSKLLKKNEKRKAMKENKK